MTLLLATPARRGTTMDETQGVTKSFSSKGTDLRYLTSVPLNQSGIRQFQSQFKADPGIILLQSFCFIASKACGKGGGGGVQQTELTTFLLRINKKATDKYSVVYVDKLNIAGLVTVMWRGADKMLCLTDKGTELAESLLP